MRSVRGHICYPMNITFSTSEPSSLFMLEKIVGNLGSQKVIKEAKKVTVKECEDKRCVQSHTFFIA